MDEKQAIDLIRAYCEGRISPEEFELSFYAEDSCMDSLLGDQTTHWPWPIKDTPYFDLLDVNLTRDVEAARAILRAFLEMRPEREPVTPQLLNQVESRLRVRLPMAYRQFVTENDPLRMGPRTIAVLGPVPEHLSAYLDEGKWTIDRLFAPSLDENDSNSILQTLPMRKEWDLPEGLVLLDGDGHTWTALDYRSNPSDPPVVFVESDTGDTWVLANSMKEFLDRLVEEDEP